MSNVKDGRVWCEGCGQWLKTTAAYRIHRLDCPRLVPLVEERSGSDVETETKAS